MPRTAKTATSATHTTTKRAAPRTHRPRKTVAHVAEQTAPVVRPKVVRNIKRTYIFAVGRRKEAVARVRWHLGSTESMTVNGRPMAEYFPTKDLQSLVVDPLVITEQEAKGAVTAKVNGGGIQGQAESVRLGIARALVKMDPDFRLTLKRAGYLRRDPRAKERKKYGLKRARRAPQWQKR